MLHRAILFACLFPLSPLQAQPPKEIQTTGGIATLAEGEYVAQMEPGQINFPIQEERTFRATIYPTDAEHSIRVSIRFHLTEHPGYTTSLRIAPPEDETRKDGVILITWPLAEGRTSYYLRPNHSYFTPEQRKLHDWEKYPAATGRPLQFEARHKGERVEFWIDGRFVHERETTSDWKEITLYLEPGAKAKKLVLQTGKEQTSTEAIDLGLTGRGLSKLPADYTIEWQPGITLPAGLQPLYGQTTLANIALAGLGKLETANVDFSSALFRKNTLQGLPQTWISSVPMATYHQAWVLCVAEEDQARFTLRLTRYGQSRGDALADTEVVIPSNQATQVGTVHIEGKTRPLWLVKVPLRTGEILDLLYDDTQRGSGYFTHRYLEIEALDLPPFLQSYASFPPNLELRDYSTLPTTKESSAHLLGVALEHAPADLKVTAPFTAFYQEEKGHYLAKVSAREAGDYRVGWAFSDIEGKIVTNKSLPLRLKANETGQIEIPIPPEKGWYASRIVLIKGNESLVDYRGATVILAPDQRQAGAESPFGTWWFNWAHGGTPDLDRNGPVFLRAGLRQTILSTDSADHLPESATAPWKIYLNAIPWLNIRSQERAKLSIQERLERHEAHIRRHLERWPSVRRMLIWHESGDGGAPDPSELWGKPAGPISPLQEAAWYQESWESRLAYLPRLAAMVRDKFPQLRLQYGNDGNSLRAVGQLLRSQYPRELIDSIAVESLALNHYPESPAPDGLQGIWFLRETARRLGYPDIPVTACYEWINRRDYGEGRGGALGLRRQAEWYVRDAIHSMAYGLDSISLGTLHDAGNAYYYSLYGAGGFTRRYPEMQPKPSYAAIATATQILEGARFEQNRLTEILSLHVMEFRKGDQWLYAIWTERGERDLALRFTANTPIRQVDLYGRETSLNGPDSALVVSSGPTYLLSASRLETITPGTARYPLEQPPVLSEPRLELSHDGEVQLQPAYETPGTIPQTVNGDYSVTTVEDQERGSAIELRQNPNQAIWGLQWQSIQLRFINPLPPQDATHAGVWVKGNGSGALIRFRVRNKDGKEWLTNDWDTYRYANMGLFNVNFDGWHFVSHPLHRDPRWEGSGHIVALVVAMPRERIHGTETVEIANPTLRFRDITLFTQP